MHRLYPVQSTEELPPLGILLISTTNIFWFGKSVTVWTDKGRHEGKREVDLAFIIENLGKAAFWIFSGCKLFYLTGQLVTHNRLITSHITLITNIFLPIVLFALKILVVGRRNDQFHHGSIVYDHLNDFKNRKTRLSQETGFGDIFNNTYRLVDETTSLTYQTPKRRWMYFQNKNCDEKFQTFTQNPTQQNFALWFISELVEIVNGIDINDLSSANAYDKLCIQLNLYHITSRMDEPPFLYQPWNYVKGVLQSLTDNGYIADFHSLSDYLYNPIYIYL